MSLEINLKIKHRIDTESNWTTNNPVLMSGEIGFVSDGDYAGNFKIGDGYLRWNTLAYASNTLKVYPSEDYFPQQSVDINFLYFSQSTTSVYLYDGNLKIYKKLYQEVTKESVLDVIDGSDIVDKMNEINIKIVCGTSDVSA